MLTRSANAITYDDGGRCVELRRLPGGRWTVCTGISVIATGKTPWMPDTRTFAATEDAARALFLALLPENVPHPRPPLHRPQIGDSQTIVWRWRGGGEE